MLLKDIKKGMKVLLKDGRIVTRADSAHSLTPMITTPDPWGNPETGSIYCWEFVGVYNEGGGLDLIEFTDSQKKWIKKTQAYVASHGML
jgi:hypothetical protein